MQSRTQLLKNFQKMCIFKAQSNHYSAGHKTSSDESGIMSTETLIVSLSRTKFEEQQNILTNSGKKIIMPFDMPWANSGSPLQKKMRLTN